MTDIFGIIPDAKPPKGKEGHIQDIFGTWVPAPQRQEPRRDERREQPRSKHQKPKSKPEEPKKRGYVAESYIQTGKDIVKGVRLGVRGAKYLNKLRKEHNAKKEGKEFKIDSTKTMKDKEFKIKQDY